MTLTVGTEASSGRLERMEEAVEAGREEARPRQTEPLIHNEDGSLGERNSYGVDPTRRTG